MHFGLYLVCAGAISPADFIELVDHQFRDRPALGELAIETRKLSMRQVFAILGLQASTPKPFGEIAIELGYLSRADLCELLVTQMERCRPLHEITLDLGMLDRVALEHHQSAYAARQAARRPGAMPADAPSLTEIEAIV